MEKIAVIFLVSFAVSQIVGYLMLAAWQKDEGPLEIKERRRMQRASFVFWPFFFFLVGMALYRHIEIFVLASVTILAGILFVAGVWSICGWGEFLDTMRITISGITTWFVVSLIIAVFRNPAALPRNAEGSDPREET